MFDPIVVSQFVWALIPILLTIIIIILVKATPLDQFRRESNEDDKHAARPLSTPSSDPLPAPSALPALPAPPPVPPQPTLVIDPQLTDNFKSFVGMMGDLVSEVRRSNDAVQKTVTKLDVLAEVPNQARDIEAFAREMGEARRREASHKEQIRQLEADVRLDRHVDKRLIRLECFMTDQEAGRFPSTKAVKLKTDLVKVKPAKSPARDDEMEKLKAEKQQLAALLDKANEEIVTVSAQRDDVSEKLREATNKPAADEKLVDELAKAKQHIASIKDEHEKEVQELRKSCEAGEKNTKELHETHRVLMNTRTELLKWRLADTTAQHDNLIIKETNVELEKENLRLKQENQRLAEESGRAQQNQQGADQQVQVLEEMRRVTEENERVKAEIQRITAEHRLAAEQQDQVLMETRRIAEAEFQRMNEELRQNVEQHQQLLEENQLVKADRDCVAQQLEEKSERVAKGLEANKSLREKLEVGKRRLKTFQKKISELNSQNYSLRQATEKPAPTMPAMSEASTQTAEVIQPVEKWDGKHIVDRIGPDAFAPPTSALEEDAELKKSLSQPAAPVPTVDISKNGETKTTFHKCDQPGEGGFGEQSQGFSFDIAALVDKAMAISTQTSTDNTSTGSTVPVALLPAATKDDTPKPTSEKPKLTGLANSRFASKETKEPAESKAPVAKPAAAATAAPKATDSTADKPKPRTPLPTGPKPADSTTATSSTTQQVTSATEVPRAKPILFTMTLPPQSSVPTTTSQKSVATKEATTKSGVETAGSSSTAVSGANDAQTDATVDMEVDSTSKETTSQQPIFGGVSQAVQQTPVHLAPFGVDIGFTSTDTPAFSNTTPSFSMFTPSTQAAQDNGSSNPPASFPGAVPANTTGEDPSLVNVPPLSDASVMPAIATSAYKHVVTPSTLEDVDMEETEASSSTAPAGTTAVASPAYHHMPQPSTNEDVQMGEAQPSTFVSCGSSATLFTSYKHKDPVVPKEDVQMGEAEPSTIVLKPAPLFMPYPAPGPAAASKSKAPCKAPRRMPFVLTSATKPVVSTPPAPTPATVVSAPPPPVAASAPTSTSTVPKSTSTVPTSNSAAPVPAASPAPPKPKPVPAVVVPTPPPAITITAPTAPPMASPPPSPMAAPSSTSQLSPVPREPQRHIAKPKSIIKAQQVANPNSSSQRIAVHKTPKRATKAPGPAQQLSIGPKSQDKGKAVMTTSTASLSPHTTPTTTRPTRFSEAYFTNWMIHIQTGFNMGEFAHAKVDLNEEEVNFDVGSGWVLRVRQMVRRISMRDHEGAAGVTGRRSSSGVKSYSGGELGRIVAAFFRIRIWPEFRVDYAAQTDSDDFDDC